VKLIPVAEHRDAPKLLYRLLEERTPDANISHKEMPSWLRHLAFIGSDPYDSWYVIAVDYDDVPAGAIYLTWNSEIGIGVLGEFQGRGYGPAAIERLMALHPRSCFFANINPRNRRSIIMFSRLGFELLREEETQNVYALEAA
jgi:RimJ/RimL family protein N-acetyltransferase